VAEGLSLVERQRLADRLAAMLRRIGLDCEVIRSDAVVARSGPAGRRH
jgi:hypothetical protein